MKGNARAMKLTSAAIRARSWWKRASGRREFSGKSAQGPSVLTSLEPHEAEIIEAVRDHTMISGERLLAVMDAVTYLEARDIQGAFVECGVWRGGTILAMIKTLQRLGSTDREIYLYDTFEGMTAPTSLDTSPYEKPALVTWREAADGVRPWSQTLAPDQYSLKSVKQLIASSGYPKERVHFVKGPVEDTLPSITPGAAALVRLDTDFYESTLHELEHLYPLMPSGGVLIIDDYGHWRGAREATDAFFQRVPSILLARTDYTGRMAVKF